MSTLGTVQLLFGALALIMIGLGLSLEIADFQRLMSEKRAVVIALVLQMIVMPLVAFALALALQLPPVYAAGMILLAAAPGSISANLYSHVFGGNVALNVSLTGINTLLSMVTLPLISSLALAHFGTGGDAAGAVVQKLGETMATLTIPVLIGMAIRAKAPSFAARADKPMRILSLIVLIAFSLAAIVKEWSALVEAFTKLGAAVVAFNALSLAMGYWVARKMALSERSSISIMFQIGVRSAVLAIYIAMTALNDFQLALPAAVYSITMVVFALGVGTLIKRRKAGRSTLDQLQPAQRPA